MTQQRPQYTEVSTRITQKIINAVAKANGQPVDMLAILESVTAAIIMVSSIPGREDETADKLCEGIKERMKLLHLLESKPGGSA